MHCVKLLGQCLMAREFNHKAAEMLNPSPSSIAAPLMATHDRGCGTGLSRDGELRLSADLCNKVTRLQRKYLINQIIFFLDSLDTLRYIEPARSGLSNAGLNPGEENDQDLCAKGVSARLCRA
jgi:hypothetical protein